MTNRTALAILLGFVSGCGSTGKDSPPGSATVEAGRPAWVQLHSPDPGAAREFYSGLFGWTFEFDTSLARLDGRAVASVVQHSEDGPFPAGWAVSFGTPDLNAFVEEALELGAQIRSSPRAVANHGRTAFVEDPTGATFHALQPAPRGRASDVAHDVPGSLVWCEVYSQAPEANQAFYSAAFGLDVEPVVFTEPGFAGGQFWMLKRDGETIAGIGPALPPSMPARWNVYFATQNTNATIARAQELGGTLAFGPMDSPYGRMAMIQDSAGAAFFVIQPLRPVRDW